jgi:hypothetical protein
MKPRVAAEQNLVMKLLVMGTSAQIFICLIISRDIRDHVSGGRFC